MSSLKYIYQPMPGKSTPACVDIETGTVSVNTLVWNFYTPFEQRVILLHEECHYLTGKTTNEIECDKYAFRRVAGTEPNSLLQFVTLIEQLSAKSNDVERVNAAWKMALQYAARRGSSEAKRILKQFN